MRKFLVLAAALAGAASSAPALAAPDLAGTTWSDDECLVAIEFHADFTFLHYNADFDFYEGRWRLEGDMLYMHYDSGDDVSSVISDNVFSFSYQYDDEAEFTCHFSPDQV